MAVIVLKSNKDNIKQRFEEVFKKLNFLPRGKILIKPNFSGRPPVINGENTDPDILRKLVEILIDRGAKKVIIGHGGLLGTLDKKFPFEKIIKEGGFSFLRKIPKTKLLDFDKEKKKLIEYEGFSFLIPKIIEEFDFYINFAKLKTHMETTITLSLKNQMGLVFMADRIKMHKTDLEKSIAYLGKLIKPTLSIIDGIIAMEGNGPHHGESRKLDLVIAGDDMVELDSVTSFLIGVNFKEVPHISIAEKIGVGKYPDKNYLDFIRRYRLDDFKLAERYEKFGKNIYVWPTTACSRCITALNESGKIIKKHPFRNLGLLKKYSSIIRK